MDCAEEFFLWFLEIYPDDRDPRSQFAWLSENWSTSPFPTYNSSNERVNGTRVRNLCACSKYFSWLSIFSLSIMRETNSSMIPAASMSLTALYMRNGPGARDKLNWLHSLSVVDPTAIRMQFLNVCCSSLQSVTDSFSTLIDTNFTVREGCMSGKLINNHWLDLGHGKAMRC